MRLIYTAVLILFVTAIAVFCLQNLETVAVKFFGWSISIPMPLLILGVYVLGMGTGWSALSFLRRSLHKATHKDSK